MTDGSDKQATGHGGARKGAGRKPKEPGQTISFWVPVAKAEYIKKEVMKLIKKLVPILVLLLVSCTKSDPLQFTKVKVEQAGELIRVFGYLPAPEPEPHRYVIEAMMRHADGRIKTEEFWVDINAGKLDGYADYQDSYKLVGWKIVYDSMLVQ